MQKMYAMYIAHVQYEIMQCMLLFWNSILLEGGEHEKLWSVCTRVVNVCRGGEPDYLVNHIQCVKSGTDEPDYLVNCVKCVEGGEHD